MFDWKTKRETVVAICGDILSTTGYSKAARAMARILHERYRVLGVSHFEDPNDRSADFPGELVSNEYLYTISQDVLLVVISHTTPDRFQYIPGAINVGTFYWETMAIPRQFDWAARIACMDVIWAPTRFIEQFVHLCGFRGGVAIMPWSHDFGPIPGQQASSTMEMRRHEVDLLLSMPDTKDVDEGWAKRPLSSILAGRQVSLAIQSLAPRKGLPILVNEWCRYIEHGSGFLLLKLSFRHAHDIGHDHRAHLLQLLKRFGVRPKQKLQIALLSQNLDDAEMRMLLRESRCLISTSFGEGFGGPIVEALVEGTPVIAPRHTGIADLLSPEYPYQISYSTAVVQLRQAVDVYPSSSSWYLPVEGSLVEAHQRLDNTSKDNQLEIVEQAHRYAKAFCGVDRVRNLLFAEIDRIEADWAP